MPLGCLSIRCLTHLLNLRFQQFTRARRIANRRPCRPDRRAAKEGPHALAHGHNCKRRISHRSGGNIAHSGDDRGGLVAGQLEAPPSSLRETRRHATQQDGGRPSEPARGMLRHLGRRLETPVPR